MKKYVVSGSVSSVWCQPHYLTWLHMMCTPYSAWDILPLASGVRYHCHMWHASAVRWEI